MPIFLPPPFVPDSQTRLTHSSNIESKHLFTIDNVPPSKWHEEFFNMYSQCTVELQTPILLLPKSLLSLLQNSVEE